MDTYGSQSVPNKRFPGFGLATRLRVRPRKDRDGFDLTSELFRYGPIWYAGPDAVRYAVAYAKYRSHFRSQRAIIRVLDDSGALVQMHE
jgi:hypothetical protein